MKKMKITEAQLQTLQNFLVSEAKEVQSEVEDEKVEE